MIRIISPKSWHSIFYVLRNRPIMYLGSPSVISLANYIDGFLMAQHVYNVKDVLNDFNYDAFEEFVRKKTKSDSRSFKTASDLSIKSSLKSFKIKDKSLIKSDWELWFEWYDEYNQSDGLKDYKTWQENNEQQELFQEIGDDNDKQNPCEYMG